MEMALELRVPCVSEPDLALCCPVLGPYLTPRPTFVCPFSVSSHGSLKKCSPPGGRSVAAVAGQISVSGSSVPPFSCASSALPSCRPHSSICSRSTLMTAQLAHSRSSPKSPRTWPTLPSECHGPMGLKYMGTEPWGVSIPDVGWCSRPCFCPCHSQSPHRHLLQNRNSSAPILPSKAHAILVCFPGFQRWEDKIFFPSAFLN